MKKQYIIPILFRILDVLIIVHFVIKKTISGQTEDITPDDVKKDSGILSKKF